MSVIICCRFLTGTDLIRSESQRIAREHYQQYTEVVNETLRRTTRSALLGHFDPTGSSFYTPLDSHNVSDDEDATDDPEVSIEDDILFSCTFFM